MTAALLLFLGVLDGCFSGFRAAAGRDGRTDKRAFAVSACVQGTKAGCVAMALLGLVLTLALTAGVPYSALVLGGHAMLAVFLPYASVVLLALVGWGSFRRLELQTLMSTLVLGPFTLVRPLLVLVGCVRAWSVTDDRAVGLLALLAGVLVLSVEPLLVRRPLPQVPVTSAPWSAQLRKTRR